MIFKPFDKEQFSYTCPDFVRAHYSKMPAEEQILHLRVLYDHIPPHRQGHLFCLADYELGSLPSMAEDTVFWMDDGLVVGFKTPYNSHTLFYANTDTFGSDNNGAGYKNGGERRTMLAFLPVDMVYLGRDGYRVTLPADTKEILPHTFIGTDQTELCGGLPEGLERIGEWAFSDVLLRKGLVIPRSVKEIVFPNFGRHTITVYKDSYAEAWAKENEVSYIVIE